jgi:hypothetical protein
MSGQDRPYIRIYFETRGDDRFDHAYECDTCWAAYSRLLMDAEAAYPAAATLPVSLKRHAKAKLLDAGIIELRPHDCFVVHGLGAERRRRSHQGVAGAAARWNADPIPLPDSERNANALPTLPALGENAMLTETSLDETRLAEPRPDAPWLAQSEPEAEVEQCLARWGVYGIPLGTKLRTRLAGLVEDHGCPAVMAACERIHTAQPAIRDAGAYIWAAVDVLEPRPNGRKPPVIVTDPQTDYDAGMSARLVEEAAK